MSAIDPVRVELVDDAGRFAALAPEWNELLAASSADCPFLTWEWLDAWWTHLRGSRRLAVLAVRRGGRLLALAPLSIVRRPFRYFSRWEFLGTGLAGSDYLDLIVRRGEEGESLRALGEYVRTSAPALGLEHLPPNALASRLTAPLVEEGWTIRETTRGICPFIRLDGHSWDSYLATLGPAHRANVRRRLRALDREFRVRFEPIVTEGQRRVALDRLFEYHERRWGGHGGSTAFGTAALRAFHHEATRRAQERGRLRLYALHLDDALAAVMYGFMSSRRFYFYQHGFDEQYAPQSVGCVLMARTIQAAIGEGAVEFDMLYGDESYKSLWAQERRPLGRIDGFPAHLGGRLHRQTFEAERTLRTLARRALSFHAS